jgi:glycolate oxidase FAD binding subunit
MAGSWGTLAAMTDVTIKVLPRPETEQTLLIRGLEPAQAIVAMNNAMGSSCDVSAAAHLPADIAARIPAQEIVVGAVTALRLEGFSPSVAARKHALEALMKPFGELATADEALSRRLWTAIRDATPFAAHPSTLSREGELWRISTAPSRGAELTATIARSAQAQMFYDWAGGLIWLTLEAADDAGAALIHRAVRAFGGHATLMRAPASVRAAIDVFAPQDRALAALTKRVKESFDPQGVLNPGRMWAGV